MYVPGYQQTIDKFVAGNRFLNKSNSLLCALRNHLLREHLHNRFDTFVTTVMNDSLAEAI